VLTVPRFNLPKEVIPPRVITLFSLVLRLVYLPYTFLGHTYKSQI
jgi:hypothetical protein